MQKKNSKKIVLSTISLCIISFVLIGCSSKNKDEKYTAEQLANMPEPQRSDLPAPTGGLVLSVNGELLPANEVIKPSVQMVGKAAVENDFEKFRSMAAPHIHKLLMDKITTILLYQKAKAKVPEAVLEEGGPLDKAVDKEIRKFVMKFDGNYARAQEEIERMGFDWQGFRDYQKKMILTQSYFSTEMDKPKPITHTDILLAYNELKDDYFKVDAETEFQLIDIIPSQTTAEDNIVNQQTIEKAQKLAEQVSHRAMAGENFTKLVKKYSKGIKAQQDGIWATSGPGSLAQPYDVIENEIQKMKVGQVSAPITAGDHIFIVKLIKKQDAGHLPIAEVQTKIEDYLKNKQKKEQFDKLLSKMLQEARIGGIEGFLDYCITQTYIRSRSLN